MKRIHDGAIGEIVGGQCYWNQGELWVIQQTPEMSDMEWQFRNWFYFTWLSGDHIVEQHVHNLDVINWAFGATPVKGVGMGGRQVRTGPGVRQHLRPLRRRVRIPERRPGRQHVPPDRRLRRHVSPSGSSARRARLRLRRDHRGRRTPWKFEGDEPQSLRPGARRPDRQHPRRQAAQRGRPHRREHADRHHGPHERLHRPGDHLGLGDERVQARPDSPAKMEFGPNPVDPVAVPGKTPLV